MNISTIIELKKELVKRYGEKKIAGFSFGIDNLQYDFKTYSITIDVVHYTNPNLIYQFVFPGVHSYKLMREEYAQSFEDEKWEGAGFYGISNHSRFEDFCFENSLFAVQYLEVREKSRSSIKTHRIAAQNDFLDVLTDNEPIITILYRSADIAD